MRNVIVTGGSRGLGLAIAHRLTIEGYHAIVIARQKSDQLLSVMREAEQSKPDSLHFVAFDLSNVNDIPNLVKRVRTDFGPIYGLVNNAAMSFDGVLATMHNSQIERLVRLNTLSPIVLTKYVVRNMMADGGGRIVNIASIIGFTGYSGLSVYAATKASMIGFAGSLAREVGRLGININTIAPGFMDTDMTRSLGPERRAQIVRRSALCRFPQVEDVADAVEFLLGAKTKNITGTVITVDAGATA
jgi:3-oxoacyl-[acyl-carrier protein] reductase